MMSDGRHHGNMHHMRVQPSFTKYFNDFACYKTDPFRDNVATAAIQICMYNTPFVLSQ